MKKDSFFILIIISIFVLFNLNSCKPHNKLSSIIYFNQIKDSLLSTEIQKVEPIIQVGDRLAIVVNAFNPESAIPYNLNNNSNVGYVVENDGTIQLPQLGKKKVNGLTRKQLIEILTNELLKFVNDPIVTIQFMNFKVTVLGEVLSPGTKSIADGKVNIVEAISLAGDLTTFSNRNKILVIREVDGKREFGEVNMLSRNIFNSPYYYLHQNDIVYVEPTSKKLENDQSFVRNLSITTTIISVISTLIFLIINITK